MIRTKKKINGKSNGKSKRYGKSKKKIMKGGSTKIIGQEGPGSGPAKIKTNKGTGTIGSLGSLSKLQQKYRSKSGLFGSNGKGVFSSEALERANPAITSALTRTPTSVAPNVVTPNVARKSAQPNASSTLSSFPSQRSYSFVDKRTPAPHPPSVSKEFRDLMEPNQINLKPQQTPYYSLGTANTVEYAAPVVSKISGYQEVSPYENAQITSFVKDIAAASTATTPKAAIPFKPIVVNNPNPVPGYYDNRWRPTQMPAMSELEKVLAARGNADTL